MDVLSPSQSLGGLPSKSYTYFITLTLRYVAWKWFSKDTTISPEVSVAHSLNFKPNFKFSRLNFLFTRRFSCNAGGIAVDELVFKFWISWAVPEIFAIKVGGCIKSTEILHVFGPQFFFLGGESSPNFWSQEGRGSPEKIVIVKI